MTPRYREAINALDIAIQTAQTINRDCQDPAVSGSAIDAMMRVFETRMEELRRAVWVVSVERSHTPTST